MAEANLEKTAEEKEQIIQETRQILHGFSRKRPSLIPILQSVQGKLGYLPRAAMTEIADYLDIPAIDVYGVVTFYNQFRLNPPGKHSIKGMPGHRLPHEGRLYHSGCLETPAEYQSPPNNRRP